MCDPSLKAECVPIFTHENELGAFVSEVEKSDDDAIIKVDTEG